MAIIKPIKYKGLYPYFWEISKVEEYRNLNQTKATLSLYSTYDSFIEDKINNIIYSVSIDLDGIMLSDDDISNQIILKNEFKNGTNVSNNYNLNNFTSPVFIIDENPDKTNLLKRSIEVINYITYLNKNLLLLILKVHFYTKKEIPNPLFDGTNEEYILIDNEEYDVNLDKEIALVIDDYSNLPLSMTNNVEIGEYTYFKSLESTMNINDILKLGINYALQMNYIDKRLYGNI